MSQILQQALVASDQANRGVRKTLPDPRQDLAYEEAGSVRIRWIGEPSDHHHRVAPSRPRRARARLLVAVGDDHRVRRAEATAVELAAHDDRIGLRGQPALERPPTAGIERRGGDSLGPGANLVHE